MARMGGWGILDYGLRFAPEFWDWLQLYYAPYLSSWELMNTGRAETDYGYWFPGPENDGAADRWEIRVDGRRVEVKPDANSDYPLRAEIAMGSGPAKIEMLRVAVAK